MQFLIILFAAVQISMECKAQESLAGYTKLLNSHKPKTYMCRFRVNQHLIVLNLYSVSITEILVTELVSKDLNLIYIKYVNTMK